MKHIIVVGGGVIGVCCAYYLSKAGARVTLVEREEIGAGASSGNAGTIAPGHGPLNKPGRIKNALKQMFDATGPLYIAPRWDLELARWLWAFRHNSTEQRYRSGMAALAPLSHETWKLFERLVKEETLDCNYRATGYYELCRSKQGLERAQDDADLMREFGFPVEILSAETACSREPALREDILGGVYFPQSATCDPSRFLMQMADRARSRGTTICTGRTVVEVLAQDGRASGIRTDDGQTVDADAVVLATGAYSLELLRRLGWTVPIQAGKGYHQDLGVSENGAPPLNITCVFSETSVFCTPLEGFVRFAGTMELSGVNHKIRRTRLQQLTTAAAQYLQRLETRDRLSEWCGLRPCTPDGLPIIGPVPGIQGLYVANGHGMLGLTLAPVTGKMIAECVLAEKRSLDLKPFTISRFN